MSQTKRKYAFSLTLSAIVVKIIGAFFKVPLLHILGDEGMGYFNTAYTIYAFLFLLCTAGVPKGVSIFLAEKKNSRMEFERQMAFCVRLFFWIGLCCSCLLAVFSFTITKWIGNAKAGFTLVLMAPSLLFITLSGVLKGICYEEEDFLHVAVSDLLESVLKLSLGLGFCMIAIRNHYDLPIVSALSVLGITIGAFIGFSYLFVTMKVKKQILNIRQNITINFLRRDAEKLFSLIFPITLSAGINSVCHIVDLSLIMRRLIDGGVEHTEAISLYGNYTTLVIPLYSLGTTIAVTVSLSALSSFCRQKNDAEAFSYIFHRRLAILMYLLIPFSFGLFFFGDCALSLLFPASSVVVATPLLKLMSVAIILSGTSTLVFSALEAKGYPRIPFLCITTGCIVKIIVSYFAIGNPAIGIKGAPLGTLISAGIILSLGLFALYRKTEITVHLLYEYLLPFFFTVPSLFIVYYYRSTLANPPTYLENLISVVLGGMCYLCLIVMAFAVAGRSSRFEKLSNIVKKQNIFLAKKTKES